METLGHPLPPHPRKASPGGPEPLGDGGTGRGPRGARGGTEGGPGTAPAPPPPYPGAGCGGVPVCVCASPAPQQPMEALPAARTHRRLLAPLGPGLSSPLLPATRPPPPPPSSAGSAGPCLPRARPPSTLEAGGELGPFSARPLRTPERLAANQEGRGGRDILPRAGRTIERSGAVEIEGHCAEGGGPPQTPNPPLPSMVKA